MYYILQDNTFNEDGYDRLVIALDRLSLEYEIVKVLPFIESVELKTNRKDLFVFGSIKLARLLRNKKPGSYEMPHKHFIRCEREYLDNMLNYGAIVRPIKELPIPEDRLVFIRPCDDDKLFTGGLYTKEDWDKILDRMTTNGWINNQFAVMSEPKQIYKEIRFWIVGQQVITGSSYRLGGQVNYNAPIDNEDIEFCYKMIKIHRPAPAFVMDVCLVESGHKIVECGCINAAGFYSADMQRLLIALEEYHKEVSK